MFANLSTILEASGSNFQKVIKATVFLKDIKDFTIVNEIYAKYLEQDSPARSAVQVASLPKDVLVEIELIAMS